MSVYFFVTLKRYIEQLIMFPFILTGNIIARLTPLDKEYDFFMFFPIYGIGGAEKVNAEVVAALPDQKIIIFFTRKSPEDTLLHLFQQPNVTIKDISKWTDNKFLYWANLIYRGICARYINRQKMKPVVFNGQCNFAYKLFPHIRKGVLKVELIHNTVKQFAWVTFPYIPFIDKRVTFATVLIEQHREYYRELGIAGQYAQRWHKITNCVYVPPQYTPKERGPKLKVYYAGRGGYHKHLELLFEIIRQCMNDKVEMEFHLAGTFEDEIPADIREKIQWHGSISKQEDMYRLHQSMDVLLMTSRREGFPMAMSEAMSCGTAIVTTNVGGIPEHITHGVNGFMMKETDDDATIVQDGVAYLKKLAGDHALLDTISQANYVYAKQHFSQEVFTREYRKVFEL